jgi:peptidylprolyl isomerase
MEQGDLILADYTATVKDTGDLVETTVEEDAKKLGSHDPTRKYEARLIAVGDGWVLKGVDEALAKANVGDNLSIDIDPEKGFGSRDPSKVRMMPTRRFGEKADKLTTGDEVEVDGRVGLVRFVGSGRTQVDFNHRYAGKVISYNLTLRKKLESQEEKIKAIARRRLPIDEDKLKVQMNEGTAILEFPEEYYLAEGLQIIKQAVANDVFKYLETISNVRYLESYTSPKLKEKKDPDAAALEATDKEEGDGETVATEGEIRDESEKAKEEPSQVTSDSPTTESDEIAEVTTPPPQSGNESEKA